MRRSVAAVGGVLMAGEAKRKADAAAEAAKPEVIAERWRKAVGRGLMIGTPIFGGTPQAEYLSACEDLFGLLAVCDAPHAKARLTSESLVPRARNYIARALLESDMEWLLFIDADIVFQASDVLALLETGYHVVGGAYPRKQIEWDHVIGATKLGIERPARFASSYVVNLLPEDVAEGAATFDGQGCVEVLDLPTGFLLIHRTVFERLREEIPRAQNQDVEAVRAALFVEGYDASATRLEAMQAFARLEAFLPRLEYMDDAGPGSRPCWNFFPIPVVTENSKGRLLSEDYAFCRMWQSIGGRCYLHTELELHHVGRHVFRANRDLILEGATK